MSERFKLDRLELLEPLGDLGTLRPIAIAHLPRWDKLSV